MTPAHPRCRHCGGLIEPDQNPTPREIIAALRLTRSESRVAVMLVKYFGNWVVGERLRFAVYANNPDGGSLQINWLMKGLRRKLEATPLKLETIMGRGSDGSRRLIWKTINPHVVAGKVRTQRLSPERRSEIARMGANAMWRNQRNGKHV